MQKGSVCVLKWPAGARFCLQSSQLTDFPKKKKQNYLSSSLINIHNGREEARVRDNLTVQRIDSIISHWDMISYETRKLESTLARTNFFLGRRFIFKAGKLCFLFSVLFCNSTMPMEIWDKKEIFLAERMRVLLHDNKSIMDLKFEQRYSSCQNYEIGNFIPSSLCPKPKTCDAWRCGCLGLTHSSCLSSDFRCTFGVFEDRPQNSHRYERDVCALTGFFV